jgi:glycine hydroxymethyltransferase
LNKNSVPRDTSALIPGGIRIGSPAMTTRGMVEADFVRVANLIDKGVKIAIDVKKQTEGGKLKDFKDYLEKNDLPEIKALRNEVETFAAEFHMPGGVL